MRPAWPGASASIAFSLRYPRRFRPLLLPPRHPIDEAVVCSLFGSAYSTRRMSAVEDNLTVGAEAEPQFRRPVWPVGVLMDALLGIAAYLAAYWLRFHGGSLATFIPGVWSTAPLVVSAQVLVLALLRAYARLPKGSWLTRVAVGTVLGTLAGTGLVAVTRGFNGVSRVALAADALFFAVAALTWRCVWVLRSRSQRALEATPGTDLVDRAAELTTVRSVVFSLYSYRELLKNLVFKDLKLKYRGSVFGFLWSLANPLLMIVGLYARVHLHPADSQRRLRVLPDARAAVVDVLRQLGGDVDGRDRRQRRAAEERAVPACDSANRHGAVQPRAVPADRRGVPAGDDAVVPGAAGAADAAVPGVPGAAGRSSRSASRSILATATAFFRDVRHLLEVALSVLFWTTPIIYELRQVPERLQLLMLLSPMSSFVVGLPADLLLSGWPDADRLGHRVRARAGRLRGGGSAVSRLRGSLHGAALMPVIEAQDVSKRFLLRHNAAVELKVRFLAHAPARAAPVDRAVLGAEASVARDRAAAKRSGWSGGTDRARARCSS